MTRSPVLLGVAGLIGALAVSVGAMALRSGAVDPAADRAALIKNGSMQTRGLDYIRGYDHLIEGLPNVTHGPTNERFSDSVVVGTITAVDKYTGVIDIPPVGAEGNYRNEKVPFDSRTAHYRSLKVTVTVTDVVAGPAVSTLVLDWGVMGSDATGEDADAISRALKDLGTVMLTTKAHAPNPVGWTRILADPWTALAQVGADGMLNYPLIAADTHGSPVGTARSSEAFIDGVDTVAEVREAAAKPTWAAPRPSRGMGG